MASDNTPLDGTAALVTGASAGIGLAAARSLARDGSAVALAARREERLRDIADEIESEFGVATHVVPTDVTDEAQVESMVADTVEAFGGLDTVVTNAAVSAHGPLEEMTTERYRTAMAVNTDGMFFTTRAVLPHLRESKGMLIFVGSFAGQYPRAKAPLYAATKWWTRGLALSLAAQVGQDDIGISVINPTEVRTEFGGDVGAPAKERLEPGEVTEPETIGDAIAFAASQEPPNTATEIDLYRRDKFETF